ncbi:MAG TPA: hypothetical protein VF669_01900 [Tepidisphaeraceae bacterium]|jgi:hypothetical protein
MSRAYTVYILTAALLVGGMWLVLKHGARLRAPDDLSGAWTLRWEKPPPEALKTGTLRVDQSGRFFTLHFDPGPALSLTLATGWTSARQGTMQMKLKNDKWTVACSGARGPKGATPEELMLDIHGPSGDFLAFASRPRENVAKAPNLNHADPPSGEANAR